MYSDEIATNSNPIEVSDFVRDNIAFGLPVSGLISVETEKALYSSGLYIKPEYEAIKNDLSTKLSAKRYQHVLNVAQTAVLLARSKGYDVHIAYLTGLLHDCAKYMDDESMLKAAEDNHISLDDTEKEAVQLVHAKVGAYFAQEKYGITDEDILNAIRYHTTGRPNMSLLEKIIYIADYIEPGRNFDNDFLNIVRTEALSDLDNALLMILEHTYSYLLKTCKDSMSPMTEKAYFYYKTKKESIKQ